MAVVLLKCAIDIDGLVGASVCQSSWCARRYSRWRLSVIAQLLKWRFAEVQHDCLFFHRFVLVRREPGTLRWVSIFNSTKVGSGAEKDLTLGAADVHAVRGGGGVGGGFQRETEEFIGWTHSKERGVSLSGRSMGKKNTHWAFNGKRLLSNQWGPPPPLWKPLIGCRAVTRNTLCTWAENAVQQLVSLILTFTSLLCQHGRLLCPWALLCLYF